MKFTIEQARKYRGITIEIMAGKLKMSRKTYIDYEKYRRFFRIDTAENFLKYVDLNYEDVLFLNKNYNSSVINKEEAM
ncbi:transcriptional regulator [Bacillus cereus]|uniref:Transcriptional regulator n=1 Tax=Bacillus cereus TaxID=1396 RepID=A0A9X7GWS7_BACCE|nr:helix-turn-helix transcriptional regulator [Bacillus cereus]PGS80539.1 transcriptional regulator [Bacillus cereus]